MTDVYGQILKVDNALEDAIDSAQTGVKIALGIAVVIGLAIFAYKVL